MKSNQSCHCRSSFSTLNGTKLYVLPRLFYLDDYSFSATSDAAATLLRFHGDGEKPAWTSSITNKHTTHLLRNRSHDIQPSQTKGLDNERDKTILIAKTLAFFAASDTAAALLRFHGNGRSWRVRTNSTLYKYLAHLLWITMTTG